MKEINQSMLDDHLKWKCEWSKEGSPGEFYEWLLDNLEKKFLDRPQALRVNSEV